MSLAALVLVLAARPDPVAVVHAIDVGQGAAMLLEFPCGAILVDAGGTGTRAKHLTKFLDDFFKRRIDLDKTLQSVVLTHCHIDHDTSLEQVVKKYKVKRLVYNGHKESKLSGAKPLNAVLKNQATNHVKPVVVTNEMVHGDGLTNADIDPLSCADCDPEVFVLSSSRANPSGWSATAKKNENNHSVVLRVDFGASSLLITGDLEEKGIESLMDQYDGTDRLDVDVYTVGHHGAANATTPAFLAEISPKIALINVGHWRDGVNDSSQFTTWKYRHPREDIVNLLRASVTQVRATTKTAYGGTDAYTFKHTGTSFHKMTIGKAVYATGWDGDVAIEMKLDGTVRAKT